MREIPPNLADIAFHLNSFDSNRNYLTIVSIWFMVSAWTSFIIH
jgi:hypothetical protein